MENNILFLKNANVIDVENGHIVLTNITIVNGCITKVESETNQETKSNSNVTVLDLKEKWVIPGLIDMHVHIKEGFAPLFTASGVTTVRNTGGNVDELKDIIHASIEAPTPRVISADRIIDGPPGLWGETSPWNMNADSPQAAQEEVRRQIEAGADFIKVYGWLPNATMKAVVEEADKYNKEVSCDLVHSKDVTAIDAAMMGVKWNEHASGIAQDIYPEWTMQADDKVWESINWEQPDREKIEQVCKVLIEHNVVICPTMVLLDQAMHLENYWYPVNDVTKKLEDNAGLVNQWKYFLSQPASLESLGRQATMNKAITKSYFDLGGQVVAGTDTPAGIFTIPGMALHRELELFVQAGITEIDAIRAATLNAAKALKRPDLGVIKEGAIADIVILNENPLENIQHTQEINLVIKGGTIYTQKELFEQIPDEETIMKNLEAFMDKYEVTIVNK
ncbi:amidohydrolase family protein [Psychrobacillus sp. INOP01]|uniref:amidohydrolase family protein n=1 Tax=Psychrobacillus sp. INOP01 TaxID=2829187 RepID=UPI001BA93A15|nr:amidohydrolase family protein [Psychrobacillus sp. INOP01]QUG42044.1 amidohydrolase family protein [Psychrobacillus sp. INOP01]